jgi:hypothetical protein
MKQCPLCHRTYADDLNFCLEDGKVLQAYGNNEKTVVDDEATLVYPQPVPSPPTPRPPGPPTPQPLSQGKRWTIGAVIGTIVIVLLWGGLKLALWSMDRDDHSAQSNSAPPSPSPNSDPLCLLTNTCPSPTPTVTPRPSPSPSPSPSPPSPSPSPTIAEPVERSLSLGSYESERTIESDGRATLLKLKLTLYSDGTYLNQGYVTFHGTGISDLLGLEEKGSVSQSKDQLIFRDRVERKFDMEGGSWSAWTTARGGSSIRQQIRNVTATTFQMYDNDEKIWSTFSKL